MNNLYDTLDEAREAAAQKSRERNYRSIYIYYVSPILNPNNEIVKDSKYKVSLVRYIDHPTLQFIEKVLSVSPRQEQLDLKKKGV